MSKKKYECFKPPSLYRKKILKNLSPWNTATSLQEKPERSNEKKIKQAKCVLLLLQHQTSLWKEKKNQETERKAFF